MPRSVGLLPLLPALFALIALVFSGLSLSSRDWAVRYQYADTTNITTQIDAIYTLYRSPFQICSVVTSTSPVAINANGTAPPVDIDDGSETDSVEDFSEDVLPPEPADINITYTQVCQSFRPFGRGSTSCELGTDLQNITLPNLGDRRQCQQVHYSGNFGIAGTVFVGLGFLCTLLHLIAGLFRDSSSKEVDLEQESRRRPGIAALSSYLVTMVFLFLPIGAACILISQFYGILGLVQSAPNNGDFISSTGNAEHHDPWVQGRALSTFLTVSWGFASLATAAGGISRKYS